MEAAKAAAQSFVDQKRPEDSIALVSFSDTAVVQTGFTTNANDLNGRISALAADGETAFNDGVILGLSLFDGAPANLLQNVIVLTDGEDTVSQATAEDALAAVGSADARVFAVALESPDFNPDAVAAVATAGNGLFLSTPDPAQLSGLYSQISREISNTLVARFVSPVATPGEAEFAVSYPGGLTSTVAFPVSGYAVSTTTLAPTTTSTPVEVTGSIVEGTSPLGLTNLSVIAAAGIGLTAFLFIVILFGRDEEQGGGRFAKRLQAYGRRSRTGEDEKKPFLQRIPILNRFSQAAEEEVRRRGLLSGVNAALEQANVPMTPGEAILAMIGLSAVGGVFLAIFNSAMFGLIAFGALLLFFAFLIRYAGNRERKRFERQLPDTLTLLSTSLRAGYSLLQAIEAVAQEAPDPTAREFSRAVVEARLGRSVPDSLQGIVARTQSKDFEWATMAIEIQREVGGNLAEVLQTVADTMLARNRLKGEIRALTAEGRISAIVLGSLPFALGVFLWFNNRDYLQPLLDATMGRIALVAGGILMAGGIFWLRKIVGIEV
jgi:tight adherence protein B